MGGYSTPLDPDVIGANSPAPAPPQQTPAAAGTGQAAVQAATGVQPKPASAPAAPAAPGMAAPGARPKAAQPAVVLTTARRGGIFGVMDAIGDAMAGRTRPEMATDQQGNPYVKQRVMGRGEQWVRIARDTMQRFAAGMAAGQGGANKPKALLAAMNEGDKQQKQRSEEEQQVWLEVANAQKLKHETAANALTLKNYEREGMQHDIEFSQKQADRLVSQGEEKVGHIESVVELAKFMRETPNFNADQVGKPGEPTTGAYTPVATYGPDGKANGFDLYRKPPGSDEEMVPAGTELPFFNPVKGEMEYQKSSQPMKRADANAVWMQAGNAAHKWAVDQADIEYKKSQTKKNNEPPPKEETPSTTAKNVAETARAWAEAHKAQAEADAAASGQQSQALVDMIGKGQMPVGRMSYLMARKPEILDAVSEKYPDFDGSKIEGYTSAVKEFESTKPGTAGYAINAGGTVLTHLNQLRKLNTNESHIPGTADWKAYHAQVNVLSDELGKFYNADTIPGIKGFADSLGSNLPGTRDAGIKTIASSMLAKFDSYREQWSNAAPSPVYEAKLPWIAPEHEQSRLELQRAYKLKALPTPEHATPPRPAGVPANAVWNPQANNGRGMWQPPQQ